MPTPPSAPFDNDPPPTPPTPPEPDACCNSGCDPCIFDFYNEDLQTYRRQLAAWQTRHPEVRKVD